MAHFSEVFSAPTHTGGGGGGGGHVTDGGLGSRLRVSAMEILGLKFRVLGLYIVTLGLCNVSHGSEIKSSGSVQCQSWV